MKKIFIGIIVALLFLVLGISFWALKTGKLLGLADITNPATPTYTNYPDPQKGAIKGKTLKSDGSPIMDAWVSLYDSNNNPTGHNFSSRSDGSYELLSINPGTYKVKASKSGYRDGERTGLVVQAGKSLENVNLTLQTSTPTPSSSSSTSVSPSTTPDPTKFIYLAEIVDSQSGELIKDVQVEITATPPPTPSFMKWTGSSKGRPVDRDKYGNANLVALDLPWKGPFDCQPGGTLNQYTVSFHHPEYQDSTQIFLCDKIILGRALNVYTYTAQAKLVKIERFYLEGNITGKIPELNLVTPLEDASVSLIYNNDTLPNGGVSDENGDYKIDITDLGPGRYRVFAYFPTSVDRQKEVKEINIVSRQNQRLDFELELARFQSTDLLIRLLDDHSKPITIPEQVDQDSINLLVSDRYRYNGEGYTDDSFELINQDGVTYLKVTGMPCGLDITVEIKAQLKDSRNLVGVKNFRKKCSEDTVKYLEIKLSPKTTDDSRKPNVSGFAYFKKTCQDTEWLGPLFIDSKVERVEIILKKSDGTEIRTDLNERGEYLFIDVAPGLYTFSINSSRYLLVEKNLTLNVKNADIEKNIHLDFINENDNILVLEKNGVKLYFVGPLAKGLAQSVDWDRITEKLVSDNNSLKDDIKPTPSFPPIVITDTIAGGGNSFVPRGFDCQLFGLDSFIRVESSHYIFLEDNSFLLDAILHEYGHYVNTNNNFGNILTRWKIIFDTARDSADANCVFGTVNDCYITTDPSDYTSGHPEDNQGEFFASFFSAYFNYPNKLSTRINHLPPGSDCLQILGMAIRFFQEKVSNGSIETNSNYKNYYRSFDNLFKPKGGSLGDTFYTSHQIEKGLWRQSVYDGISITDKFKVNVTRATSEIMHFLKIDPVRFKTKIDLAIAKFNNLADKLFPGGNRGNIQGKVYTDSTQWTPRGNAVVIIGRRMAMTDNNGNFSIQRAHSGNQEVKIIDGRTSTPLTPQPNQINIQKDKTTTVNFTAQ